VQPTPDLPDYTPRQYPSPPIRLSAGDLATERTECWRDDCRDRWPGYGSVTWLSDGRIVAWCHRRVHDDLGLRVDLWRHGMAA
jgi:hypothetical protein